MNVSLKNFFVALNVCVKAVQIHKWIGKNFLWWGKKLIQRKISKEKDVNANDQIALRNIVNATVKIKNAGSFACV